MGYSTVDIHSSVDLSMCVNILNWCEGSITWCLMLALCSQTGLESQLCYLPEVPLAKLVNLICKMGITVVPSSYVMKGKRDKVYKVNKRVLDTQKYLASVGSYYY